MIVQNDIILTTTCLPVTPACDAAAIARELRRAMTWSADNGRPALGLAAPQIGEPFRIFVLQVFPYAFVNPRVLKASADTAVANEGCLSLPRSTLVPVRRSKWVKLAFEDENGVSRTLKLHGLDARCALHELDHLDGIMITDRAAQAAA